MIADAKRLQSDYNIFYTGFFLHLRHNDDDISEAESAIPIIKLRVGKQDAW